MVLELVEDGRGKHCCWFMVYKLSEVEIFV